MKELLKGTIPGAASDSSARNPPPRCHPGTRLSILKRCLDFITNCNDMKKIRWVVGAAGVGKSAIMQNVAESFELIVTSQASAFFSFNGRNDGTKANWGSSMFERESNFIVLCNWLSLTPDEAYAATNYLRSVLRVPKRDKAHQELLKPFHKSFIDYISEFTRSGFSPGIKHEAEQLKAQCALRILEEVPDGVDFGDASYAFAHGRLMCGPDASDKISLTWLVDEKEGLE